MGSSPAARIELTPGWAPLPGTHEVTAADPLLEQPALLPPAPATRPASTAKSPVAPASEADQTNGAAAQRFVAVEGRQPGETATAATVDGGSVKRQLLGVAQRAAIAMLPVLAGLLALIWLAGPLLLAGTEWSSKHWAWTVLTPAVTLALAVLPRHARRFSNVGPEAWLFLLFSASLSLAGLVALATPPERPTLTALTWVWVLCAAVALAPWRRGAAMVLWLPAVAGVLCAQTVPTIATAQVVPHSVAWLLASVVTTAATLGLVLLRHRLWHGEQRARLILEARNRLLQQERDTALRADQDKSRFVAIASHDLRQPVHALGLFAATLQKRLMNTPDEALARNFLRAVDDLEHSFSSMLDISRLESGGDAPLMHTFPLRDLFRRLHMQYAGHAEVSGLGLRFSTGGKSVTSDPQLLERIVGNLIQNAIKYTTHGGVVVVARSTSTHLNIEVWDTGAGIAPTDLPKVFQEFYQVGSGRRDRSHGLGMGLAIVKRLTELLGHRLEVASRLGRGTMFRVGIPIGALPGIQDAMAPADTVPMHVQTSQMVLIVEDEESIREGLRVLLREWGYQTITAANAAEAEQAVLALEGRVDLVLSDLQLGQSNAHAERDATLDGAAVVDNVRRLCGYAVPAVIVTGDTSAHAARKLAARGDPVLFKPVQPRRLFDAMQAALG